MLITVNNFVVLVRYYHMEILIIVHQYFVICNLVVTLIIYISCNTLPK
jgi:hypothetical protein